MSVVHVFWKVVFVTVFVTVKLFIEVVKSLNLAWLQVDVSLNLFFAFVVQIPKFNSFAEMQQLVVVLFVFILVVSDIRFLRVVFETCWAFFVYLLEVN